MIVCLFVLLGLTTPSFHALVVLKLLGSSFATTAFFLITIFCLFCYTYGFFFITVFCLLFYI